MALHAKVRPAELSVAAGSPSLMMISTPVSPGPSTRISFRPLPAEQDKCAHESSPPRRPRSTPFPQQDLQDIPLPMVWRPCDILETDKTTPTSTPTSTLTFSDLPIEIHETILDHLFGVRASTISRTTTGDSSAALRGWGSALRHSRRKQLADLALVSRVWRGSIQERLYRHSKSCRISVDDAHTDTAVTVKVKGTINSLDEVLQWFQKHEHLQPYVRHIEIWIPIWERKTGAAMHNGALTQTHTTAVTPQVRILSANGITGLDQSQNLASAYTMSAENASLENIFQLVSLFFPAACILTLEGGHCKKSARVPHFLLRKHARHESSDDPEPLQLPPIKTIRTLVIKGAWNIMRGEEDFAAISRALPNLKEWHCTYAKPKKKAYLSMFLMQKRSVTTY